MSAVAGIVGSAFGPPELALGAMVDALGDHGPDGLRTFNVGAAHFGVQFHHTLPEDDFDLQPYAASGGRFLVSADARIDNREELAASVRIPTPELRTLSDAGLLARCWERWGLGLTDRLLGDYAMAIWDSAGDELTLARGPLSSRPIFFHQSGSSIAFASIPSALLALPTIHAAPSLDEFAKLLGGGLFQASDSSFFSRIQSIPQGQARILKCGALRHVRLWSPGENRVQPTVLEAGEEIWHELDRATRAQSRRRAGPLACMLSSGRDSSAVASAAAHGERSSVLAITAAPSFPVDGLPPPWIADESSIAAKTAELAGLRYLVCRPENVDLVGILDRVSAAHFQPFNNPVNLPWISDLCRTARSNNAEVLTGGAAGNFTISLGGPSFMSDYWRERGIKRWLRLAKGLSRKSDWSWPQLLAYTFGSLVPPRPYSWLRKMSGRTEVLFDLPLLREPIRIHAEAHRRERFADVRAKPSRRQHYARLIQGIEPGDKYSLPCWGVDIRDPTADRRLAELCLALPVEAYFGAERVRPAFYHAFKDRLPAEVIDGRHTGAQAADWYLTIDPHAVLTGFRRYSQNPIVNQIFDLGEVERLVSRWPRSGAEADRRYDEYCNQLLGGLAVASFINVHFPA